MDYERRENAQEEVVAQAVETNVRVVRPDYGVAVAVEEFDVLLQDLERWLAKCSGNRVLAAQMSKDVGSGRGEKERTYGLVLVSCGPVVFCCAVRFRSCCCNVGAWNSCQEVLC